MAVQVRRALPGDADGIARVHVASWLTTYRGLVADSVLDNLSVDRRAAYWSEALGNAGSPSRHYVAESPGAGVVGFASGGPEREGREDFTSELYAIYLLEDFQGQGLGQRLVAEVVRDLRDASYTSMLVWVLAANPSRRFYTALGGRRVAAKMVAMGLDELEEIAFGWDDLADLARHLDARST